MLRRTFLIILLFAATTFGVYAAPNEDTVIVVGGLGTQANKAQLNGGGATLAAWNTSGDPNDFINTNGGPITTAADCSFTTATKVLASTGIGTGVTVGTLCYVSAGAHITAGIYEVTAQTNDSITCAQIDDDGTNDTNITVNVGGALDSLQHALDEKANNGAAHNRYIYTNITTETIGATIDADTYGGSGNTRVIVKGANSSCVVDGTRVIITTAADLTSGLLSVTSTSTYMQWWYFDFNAAGAGKADYCVYNAADQSSASYHCFFDCIFRNAADATGVFAESTGWQLYGCEIDSCGDGMWADLTCIVVGCSIHDNTGEGLKWSGPGKITNNIIYDNGANGILTDGGADFAVITGNTIFGNTGDGIDLVGGGDGIAVFNNTSCGNGAYGYQMVDRGNTVYFAYNHSCDGLGNANDNTSGHCNLMTDATSDSEWADFYEGNNQYGTPSFTNINDGSENFLPTSGSNLIDKALDAGSAGKLDIGAIQEAAGSSGGGQTIIGGGIVR